jgi:hypothetical protein
VCVCVCVCVLVIRIYKNTRSAQGCTLYRRARGGRKDIGMTEEDKNIVHK